MAEIIYHIARIEEWDKCKLLDYYIPSNFHKDKFIHCSTKVQVERIANTLFKSLPEIYLLAISAEKEEEYLKYENLEGNSEQFPHIYGKLKKSSILEVTKVFRNSEMKFRFTIQEG